MPTPVYVAFRLSRLDVDALHADDLTGHARARFHMLILLTNEKATAATDRKRVSVKVSLDAVMELLAGAVAEGGDVFFGLTGAANTHPSANPYLNLLGNHIRGHCLLRGWERLAAHTLALIVLLRAGEMDSLWAAAEALQSRKKKGQSAG